MIEITNVILIALFIEAIVNALKPIWTGGERPSVTEYVSMGMGILLAITCRINMLEYVIESMYPYPAWMEYFFYTLTGIAIGRGTSFLYDLWNKLKEWKSGKLPVMELISGDAEQYEEELDLNIAHWSLAQLRDFCALNNIDTVGCHTREDYIDKLSHPTFETIPPDEGGEA